MRFRNCGLSGRGAVALLVVALSVAIISGSVILLKGSSGELKAPTKPQLNLKTGISAPLSVAQLKSFAVKQNVPVFFWLGPPKRGEDLRVAAYAFAGKLGIAYTDAGKRKSYGSRNNVAYNNLLNTSVLPAANVASIKGLEAQLKGVADSIQTKHDFTAYVLLPPYSTNLGADIFLIDKSYNYMGRLVSGNDELVKAQRVNDLATLASQITLKSAVG